MDRWDKNLIAKKKVCKKELETMIGQLTHVSMIIPPVHHFHSRLCELLYQIKNNNRRMSNIPAVCINDLHLMKDFFVMGEQRDKHESNRIPKTHTHLSRRLMPGQIWGLQPHRIRMEISLTSKITGPCFQQPPRAHWERHLPVDQYNRWAIKRWELLFVHDRQHHIQRVDQKDKFQGRCGRHPSHNQDRSGMQPRLSFHDP